MRGCRQSRRYRVRKERFGNVFTESWGGRISLRKEIVDSEASAEANSDTRGAWNIRVIIEKTGWKFSTTWCNAFSTELYSVSDVRRMIILSLLKVITSSLVVYLLNDSCEDMLLPAISCKASSIESCIMTYYFWAAMGISIDIARALS